MKASWALQEAEANQRLQADKLRASQAAVEAMRLNRCGPVPNCLDSLQLACWTQEDCRAC